MTQAQLILHALACETISVTKKPKHKDTQATCVCLRVFVLWQQKAVWQNGSAIRVARELGERQAHAAHEDAIRAYLWRRLEPGAAHSCDDVVLIDAVAADA